MAGGRSSEQSGEMEAQSVVARNDGYRGWRHEGAVTMATKKEKEGASVVAGGGGHRRGLHEGAVSRHPHILLIWGVTAYTTHLGSNRMPYDAIDRGQSQRTIAAWGWCHIRWFPSYH